MPIVFVHGVANRLQPKYWKDLAARKKLMVEFLYEPLGLPADDDPRFAYWGDHGANFRWGHASLPSSGAEAFGSADEPLLEVIGEYADLADGDDEEFLLRVARERSLVEAVDLLFVAAAQDATDPQAESLAELAARVAPALSAGSPPAWLDEAGNDIELVTLLAGQFPAEEDDEEAFGGISKGWKRLREQLSRVRTAVPAATGRLACPAARPRLTDEFGTFIGDVLVYFERSGAEGMQSGILNAVGGEIERAARDSSKKDPLVVIAHSMGGNIVYDLFSHYRADLGCDTLVTVGSQVGLFQELDLFAAKYQEIGPPQKVPCPPNVKRWLNVYDRNDLLGFAAEPIFDGVTDFAYSTGLGLLKAHASYFLRPSFYARLADRLK